METAIQITVAGALLLAWIWVLGRPLIASSEQAPFKDKHRGYGADVLPSVDLSPDGSDLLDFDPSWGRRLVEGLKRWWGRPVEVWRRQLLMASILAAVASLLLAIALRTSFDSRFIQLFALMLLGLVIHLGIAVLVGRRLLAAGRATPPKVEPRRVSTEGVAISATRIDGGTTILEGIVASEEEEPDLFASVELEDDTESAFDLAAELASELDAVEESQPVDEAALVSGLIESEWGSEPEAFGPDEGPAADHEPAEDEPAEDEKVIEDSDPGPEEPKARTILPEEPESEPIFRRAAKDEPPRPRRVSKPIYIESQLDGDDDLPGPKAVNHP